MWPPAFLSPIGRGLERTAAIAVVLARKGEGRMPPGVSRTPPVRRLAPMDRPDPHPPLRGTFSQWEKDQGMWRPRSPSPIGRGLERTAAIAVVLARKGEGRMPPGISRTPARATACAEGQTRPSSAPSGHLVPMGEGTGGVDANPMRGSVYPTIYLALREAIMWASGAKAAIDKGKSRRISATYPKFSLPGLDEFDSPPLAVIKYIPDKSNPKYNQYCIQKRKAQCDIKQPGPHTCIDFLYARF